MSEEKKYVDVGTTSSTAADQDVYTPIAASERMKSSDVFMIFVGLWVAMFSVNIGMAVGQSLSVGPAILATILGYAICGGFAVLTGLIGQKIGLPSYTLIKLSMGSLGQILISFIMFLAVSVGSLGMQADIVGRSFCETFSISYTPVISGVVCAIMMVSAILGMKVMAKVSWVAMPFFFVIALIATIMVIHRYEGGFSAILAIENNTMTFGEAIFLNAGAWAAGAMVIPDLSRFIKTPKAVAISVPASFLVGAIPPICGVILGATLGESLDAVFVKVGLSILGFIGVFAIGWTTNDNNAYTAGLALNTALYPFKRLTRRTTTIIVAILAVAGACFGLGSLGFISFVAVFQGSFNMSLVGVMIAHYFVVSREVNRKGTYLQTTGFSGLIAWFVSGMLTYNNLLPLPFITNAVLAFVLYLALFYGIERKFKNVKEVPKVTPPRRVV